MAERRVMQNTALALVFALQTLFLPHPLAFSRLVALKGTNKGAPVIPRAATYADYASHLLRRLCIAPTTPTMHRTYYADYASHLSPDAYDGIGAIGMFPGMSAEGKQGESQWFASFLVADFDATPPLELEPLIDTLAGYSLTTYATCGTSGRGAHLYGFTESFVPQWKMHDIVAGIQTMADDAGVGVPDIRPSCKFGRGSPIFLPYRGALKDGYGYNPLLDPDRDFQPVALEHVSHEVERIPTAALETFRLEMASRASQARFVTRAKDKPLRAANTPGSKDNLTHLHDEFERVKAHFVKPHRQHLVMALTAYGVRGLELDAMTVREEVTTFVKTYDADELPKRLAALELTLTKYRNNPQRIAWKTYYVSAGLAAPGKVGVSSEVLGRLELTARTISERKWQGVAGTTDRSAYIALLLVAAEHGTVHDKGVAVSISTRDLALKAVVGDKTIRSALARLSEANLVVRDKQVRRSFTDAGTLVLVVEEVSNLPQSFLLLGGLDEWVRLYTHPAFMHGKLGKAAAPMLVVMLTQKRLFTRPELAKMLGRKSRDIRKPLERLIRHHIVVEVNNALKLSPSWEESLERAAVVTGAYFSQHRQKRIHAAERAAFHSRFEPRNTNVIKAKADHREAA